MFVQLSTPARATENDKLAWLQYVDGYWQVYVMNIKTRNSKKITSSEYDKATVSWFGDGNQLFVSGIQSEAEIININTGASKSIKLPFDSINDAVISPDGNKIIFSYIEKNSINNKLWLYDLTTNKKTKLLHQLKGRQYDPKWGDDKTYYFISGVANQSYGIEKATLGKRRSTSVVKDTRYNLDVDVSTTGKIAYSSNRSGHYDLWISSGSKNRKITDHPGLDAHPSWSSNESTLYYESSIDGITNIWSVAIDANDRNIKKPTQITFSKEGARYPAVYKGSTK